MLRKSSSSSHKHIHVPSQVWPKYMYHRLSHKTINEHEQPVDLHVLVGYGILLTYFWDMGFCWLICGIWDFIDLFVGYGILLTYLWDMAFCWLICGIWDFVDLFVGYGILLTYLLDMGFCWLICGIRDFVDLLVGYGILLRVSFHIVLSLIGIRSAGLFWSKYSVYVFSSRSWSNIYNNNIHVNILYVASP